MLLRCLPSRGGRPARVVNRLVSSRFRPRPQEPRHGPNPPRGKPRDPGPPPAVLPLGINPRRPNRTLTNQRRLSATSKGPAAGDGFRSVAASSAGRAGLLNPCPALFNIGAAMAAVNRMDRILSQWSLALLLAVSQAALLLHEAGIDHHLEAEEDCLVCLLGNGHDDALSADAPLPPTRPPAALACIAPEVPARALSILSRRSRAPPGSTLTV